MVYDIENLFGTRAEKASPSRPVSGIENSRKKSLFDYIEQTRDTRSQNNALDIDAAFARLGNLLKQNSEDALQANYRGRGSLFNIIA